MLPGGVHELCRVVIDAVGNVNIGHGVDKGQQGIPVRYGLQIVQRVRMMPVLHDLHLALPVGIAHAQPDQEPVQLGGGQHLGPGGAYGVLRGQDHKGGLQIPGLAVYGDPPLLHGLQQGGLGLGGGPVDLVRQQ